MLDIIDIPVLFAYGIGIAVKNAQMGNATGVYLVPYMTIPLLYVERLVNGSC